MKLKAIAPTTPPSPWMKFPNWLLNGEFATTSYFTDLDSLKEYYTYFYEAMNPSAQIAIASLLVQRIVDAEDRYNPFDYSKSALQFAADTLCSQYYAWRQEVAGLFQGENSPLDTLAIFPMHLEGSPIVIKSSRELHDLSVGELKWDIIFNHPGTKSNFDRYVMAKLIYERSDANIDELRSSVVK